MKYVFDTRALDEAVTRCAPVKDGYVITFSDRKVGAGSEVYVTLSASTSHTLSNITIPAVPNGPVETKHIMVGTDFGAAVHALAPAGNNVELEIANDVAVLSCGDARIPIKYLSQVTKLKICSPKTDEHALFTIETKEWKRVISQGGFAFGEYEPTGNSAVLNNIFLLPCDGGIQVVTSEGHYAASSSATIGECKEKFTDMVTALQGVCIPPASIKLINSCLKGEAVNVYLFKNQLLIKDGNDIFVVVLANSSYPMRILNILGESEFDYSFEASISDIKVALNIMSVNCSNINQATMMLCMDENGVTVSNNCGNKTSIKCKTLYGKIQLCISVKQLKDLVSAVAGEVNDITLCGKDAENPLYVMGGHSISFTLPVFSKK